MRPIAISASAVQRLPPMRSRAGLVDEVRLFVSPLTVGGGNPFLPDRLRLNLQLLEERRFDSGVVYLQYQVST
jgi:dihydrofolate reductase